MFSDSSPCLPLLLPPYQLDFKPYMNYCKPSRVPCALMLLCFARALYAQNAVIPFLSGITLAKHSSGTTSSRKPSFRCLPSVLPCLPCVFLCYSIWKTRRLSPHYPLPPLSQDEPLKERALGRLMSILQHLSLCLAHSRYSRDD